MPKLRSYLEDCEDSDRDAEGFILTLLGLCRRQQLQSRQSTPMGLTF